MEYMYEKSTKSKIFAHENLHIIKTFIKEVYLFLFFLYLDINFVEEKG